MSLKATWFRDKLRKKSKQGFQGFPTATIAYYGPNAKLASKVAVAIIMSQGAEPEVLERWFSETNDVRSDPQINEAVVHFLQLHGVKSVVMPDRIIGCPHEEGVDYPEGENCPQCPYWAGRDRFTGEFIH
ncbi:MAG: hypothetical protein IV094_09990 [Vitreoscilla sp.]|nr:hypothetical protein [Vitreoscilla sp.]